MAKVPNGVETLRKISIGRVECMNVTDGCTDDDIYSKCKCEFTFAKNVCRVLLWDGMAEITLSHAHLNS